MPVNHILKELSFYHTVTFEQSNHNEHMIHSHIYCELYFFVGGECSYIVENGVYKPQKGTVIFTRPGEMHGVHIDTDCTYERYYFSITPSIVKTLTAPELLRCFYNRPHGQQNAIDLPSEVSEHCFSLLQKIDLLTVQNLPDARPLALAAFLEILHDINCYVEAPHRLTEHTEQNLLVNRAMRYINQNLAEIRSTADIAAALYVQREYLSRKFSEHTGIPISRYITLKRIARAKTELLQEKSITEVCTQCGWKDYSYFSTVFHREVGMSPMQYKKKYKTTES
ncbi:MAG: helix-turn-helix domain-containing protein [Ruminococcaceae bacterium]|nr:helix-turn-helix domain-containing protein [Oscillospiraceae bacterium]